ncbi:MAG: Gfo/Idh/MocA family oxidoreductase [Bacteroidota bacterium]
MYQNITVAVVGIGFIGPVHIEALRRLGVNVKGVLGHNAEESEQGRKMLGLSHAYANLEELLGDEEVQAVHLAVPNRYHYEMAKACLHAGKHVMCEKPLAMTAEESQELVALAASTGLSAGVCYNIRFYPMNLEARQQVAQGKTGELYSVVGSYVQDWLLYDTDYNWRVLADQGGALRAVADIGTHWMDLITSVTGLEVEAVFADLQTVHPIRKRPMGEVQTFSGKAGDAPKAYEELNIDTEDAGYILFRFKGGARGQLHVSQITAGRKNCLRYEIAGSNQSMAWNSEQPNELWLGQRPEASRVLPKDPSLLDEQVAPYANYPGGHNEGFPDTFKQCFRAFYNAILNETPSSEALYPTFAQGHKEVVICEAILQSHKEERWIKL